MSEGQVLPGSVDSPSGDSPSGDTPSGSVRDTVVVTLPAAGAYLSVLRTTTAGLAARLDFTLDDIEDLRIAVDEACALLLADALPGSDLRCGFELTATAITITVTVSTVSGLTPSRDTFAWTVLTALAGEVDAEADPDGRVTLSLIKRRAIAATDPPAGGDR